jgi:hypothetical protein
VSLLVEVIRSVPNLPDPYRTLGALHEVMGDERKALNFYIIAAHMGTARKVCWRARAFVCVCLCRLGVLGLWRVLVCAQLLVCACTPLPEESCCTSCLRTRVTPRPSTTTGHAAVGQAGGHV